MCIFDFPRETVTRYFFVSAISGHCYILQMHNIVSFHFHIRQRVYVCNKLYNEVIALHYQKKKKHRSEPRKKTCYKKGLGERPKPEHLI